MGVSGMERIRRLLGGRADRRATVSSALASAARLQVGGLFPEPGPFDESPTETIELAPTFLGNFKTTGIQPANRSTGLNAKTRSAS